MVKRTTYSMHYYTFFFFSHFCKRFGYCCFLCRPWSVLANLDVHLHKCSFFLLLLLSAVLHFFGIQCTVTTTQKKKAGLVLHSYTHAKKKKVRRRFFLYMPNVWLVCRAAHSLFSFFLFHFFLCVLSILRRFYSTTQDNTCTYFRPDFLKEATLCLYSLSQLVISKYTTAIVFSLLFFFPFPPSLSWWTRLRYSCGAASTPGTGRRACSPSVPLVALWPSHAEDTLTSGAIAACTSQASSCGRATARSTFTITLTRWGRCWRCAFMAQLCALII